MAGPAPTAKQFGTAIREQRKKRGMTIEALAGKAKVHTTTLSGIEREGDNPTWDVVQSIVEALEIDMSKLTERAETIARAEVGEASHPSGGS
jgi:transcriptional regulator with XRE-family HTH domain